MELVSSLICIYQPSIDSKSAGLERQSDAPDGLRIRDTSLKVDPEVYIERCDRHNQNLSYLPTRLDRAAD